MAAALFRRGTRLWCIHRELRRVIWRPQAALFSSKPSDRKQPRRTHIKKAKPQPGVDVAKLLEQLFSQRRPGTAPPAVRPAQTSSMPTKHPSSSTMKVSNSSVLHLSKTEPAASVFPAASTLPMKNATTFKTPPLSTQPKTAPPTNTKASCSSETPQQSSLGFINAYGVSNMLGASTTMTSAFQPASKTPAPVAPTKYQTSAETIETEIETSTEQTSSAYRVETSTLSPVEALETKAAAVDGPLEPTVDAAAGELPTKGVISQAAIVEPLIEATIEPSLEVSLSALETPESTAVPVEALGEVAPTKSTESGVINILHTAKEELLIETTTKPLVKASTSALGILESRAAVAESTVDTTIDALQTNSTDSAPGNLSYTATEEPLRETAIESSVEENPSVLEMLESRTTVAERTVELTVDAPTKVVRTESTDSVVFDFIQTDTIEPLIETTVESSVEASRSPSENRAAVGECPVEPAVETGADTAADSLSHAALIQTEQKSAALPWKNEIESIVESHSLNTAVEDLVNESEEMSLDSVTLNFVNVCAESLKTDELLQTKSVLDEKAEKQHQELLVQTGIGAESRAAAETENSAEFESDILIKVLSKWESPSEDLQELKTSSDFHATASDPPAGTNLDVLHMKEEKPNEVEAMTLESITLAEVTAEIKSFDCKVLQETRDALENQADVFAKEEKMEVKTEREDVAHFQDTIEAEILTLDSIFEVTDALEAEISIMLESMFDSKQGLRQPPDALLTEKQQDEAIVQETEKNSREQDGSVVEAMSFKAVMLAEIEASLRTLESESLNETVAYLEEKAEILAGKKRVEVGDGAASDEMTEALMVESLSLPEADALSEALQTDALMEELLFSILILAESQSGLDATVDTGSEVVNRVSAETDDLPAPPALKEVLLGQEEEGGQTEDLDPVQKLFLEKIREYNMYRLSGEPVAVDPDYERSLLEEITKLQRLYGGGDLSSFPQFTFAEPALDQYSK
ncbi:hypothetical protein PAMA_002148 [Pampus argenteus]